MSNGLDKNWFQIIIAINGFRARYKAWPTKIRLPEGATDQILGEEWLARIEQKIKLVYDDSPFITEDDRGRSYNFEKDGFLAGADIDARVWLGLETDPVPGAVDAHPRPPKPAEITQPMPRQKGKGKSSPKQKATRKQETAAKPKTKPKPKPKRRILRTIFLWELLLVFLTIIIMLTMAALTYNGTCVSLEQALPCSFTAYMLQVIFLLPYELYVWGMQYWWAALLLAILFPLLGLGLASRKRRKGKKKTIKQ